MKKVILIFSILFGSTVAFAAEHADGIPTFVYYQMINVTLLIALLYGLTHKKVRSYFTSRLVTHEEAKRSAQRAFTEAKERHEEVSQKLTKLQAEAPAAIEKAQADAMLLKSKLIQEAEELAENIIKDAKNVAQYEYEKAKQDLRKEAFEEALKLARTDIEKNLNDNDQKDLRNQFIENIGTVQ